MRSYTRGQETFVNQVIITITNLLRLVLGAFMSGTIIAAVYLYYTLPAQFWGEQGQAFDVLKSIKSASNFTQINNIAITAQNISSRAFLFFMEYFHSAKFLALNVAIAAFFLGLLFFFRRGRYLATSTFLRGSALEAPKNFNARYKRELKILAKRATPGFRLPRSTFKSYWGKPFVFGADQLCLPEYAQYRHTAMLGTTGVGKTTLIREYIDHARSNREKGIILDINGEYAKHFYRSGDVILSLFDQQTVPWDFSHEPVPNEQFANFLVPRGSEANSFWWKGARAVLSQLLAKCKTSKELWQLINSPTRDLSSQLSGVTKKICGGEGSGQASGIAGSTVMDLGFLKHLGKQERDDTKFSLYNWAQSPGSEWVFITFRDSDMATMGPLLKIWFNLAILGVLERQNSSPAVNIIVDELASMGAIDLLPTALERARKYGGKLVLGYQSDSQLRRIYEVAADSIKANTGNKFVFRCPDANEARELSEYLGRTEVARAQTSTSYGLAATSDRENIGENIAITNVALDSEIRGLRDGEFYLRSLHMNPVRSRIRTGQIRNITYTPVFNRPGKDQEKQPSFGRSI